MIEAFGADEVRAAEAPLLATERGHAGGLMDRAATALAAAVLGELRARRGRPGRYGRRAAGGVAGSRVVALVGVGNNGGDALYALARLAGRGVAVTALTMGEAHTGGLVALRAAGGRALPGDDDAALALAAGADVVVDGLLGIGATGALRGPAADLMGRLAAEWGATRPVIVAVDVPSGIGVADGSVPGPVLPADLTVTFGVAKPGLLLPPAAHLAGRVRVVDLGLRPVLDGQGATPVVSRLTAADVADLWPVPGPTTHKYGRGVLGVLAGSAAYPGAGVLTVGGAVGAGVGMVRHVGEAGAAVLAAHPEVLVGQGPSDRVQAWVAGPGLPDAAGVAEVLAAGAPTVLDAGALDAVPAAGRLGPHVVLTPHAGELARLLTALGHPVTREQVEAEPYRWARAAHEATGATVLAKGAVTVVVGPRGAYAQADAPPWTATAGAGDVLAGIIGALLAGRAEDALADPGLSARLAAAAALVHGRAAALANPGGPVGASALAAAVPAAVAAVLAEDGPR